MKALLSSLLLQATMFAVTSVYSAEAQVSRSHRFDLGGISEIEIVGNVGEMTIVLVEGSELRLVLDIQGQDGGWFRRAKDVSGVDLESRVRDDRLLLRLDEDDTRTQWTIELPAVAATRIQLGVGEIHAAIGATDLDVELGVGSVNIEAPLSAAGRIDLSSGVGEVRVRGTRDVDSQRAFVSQNLEARGEGEHAIQARVGVGEAVVELK